MSDKPKLYRLWITRNDVQVGGAVYRWADSADDAERDVPKWMRKKCKSSPSLYAPRAAFLYSEEVEL